MDKEEGEGGGEVDGWEMVKGRLGCLVCSYLLEY